MEERKGGGGGFAVSIVSMSVCCQSGLSQDSLLQCVAYDIIVLNAFADLGRKLKTHTLRDVRAAAHRMKEPVALNCCCRLAEDLWSFGFF